MHLLRFNTFFSMFGFYTCRKKYMQIIKKPLMSLWNQKRNKV